MGGNGNQSFLNTQGILIPMQTEDYLDKIAEQLTGVLWGNLVPFRVTWRRLESGNELSGVVLFESVTAEDGPAYSQEFRFEGLSDRESVDDWFGDVLSRLLERHDAWPRIKKTKGTNGKI